MASRRSATRSRSRPASARAHAAGEDVVRPGGGVTYREAELTQDACASGRRLQFGKSSEPVVDRPDVAPYASGLSPDGKLVVGQVDARPRFYGAPLVAWQPLVGADQYEVQCEPRRLPVEDRRPTQFTLGHVARRCPLPPGTWYYRVRGIDFMMVGSKPQMSWSSPVRLVVTKPRFRVVH